VRNLAAMLALGGFLVAGVGAMVVRRDSSQLQARVARLDLKIDPPRIYSPPTPRKPEAADRGFSHLPSLLTAVWKADKIVLLEGLPHPRWQTKLLEQELRTHETTKVHDFSFYLEPLSLSKSDAEKLMVPFHDPESFSKKGEGGKGIKFCGGFHPDYALEFHVGADTYHALLCLGCAEIKIFGSAVSAYCDMSKGAHVKFKSILEPYRKNRPE